METIYSSSKYILFQMNLVCTRTIFKAHVATASVVGALIGFLTLGPIADRLVCLYMNYNLIFHVEEICFCLYDIYM